MIELFLLMTMLLSVRETLFKHFPLATFFSPKKWNIGILPETPCIHYTLDTEFNFGHCVFKTLLLLTKIFAALISMTPYKCHNQPHKNLDSSAIVAKLFVF